jgi:uncharacterized protein, YigZ family
MPNPYQTLSLPTEFCYEEKRSRFIGYIWPVATKEEGFAHFEVIKQQHPDARHHCWAYVIGDAEQATAAGFSDDGEPSGTAGKPMLNVLMQRKVGSVFAVVVRYFGGIKLGAGGLTRAYGQAVSRALDTAEFKWITPRQQLTIATDFSLEQKVRNFLQREDVVITDVRYKEESVTLICDCPMDRIEPLKALLQEQTSGRVRYS